MQSNRELVSFLIRQRALVTPRIIKAFEAIDRGRFVPANYSDQAYDDNPLAIGGGQTISQPSTVAMMLEWLQPEPGQEVLDVGSGSGWTTALLGHIVGRAGQVYGYELLPELVSQGRANLRKFSLPQAVINQAGKKLGAPELGPFERILVSAAGRNVPKELLTQIAPGGRMVIPVGKPEDCSIFVILKDHTGRFHQRIMPGFRFVPLKH